MKEGVHRKCAKFTGKHLCQSLFFNEVAATLFSGEFCKISKNTFSTEHPWTIASNNCLLCFITDFLKKNVGNEWRFYFSGNN